MYSGGHIDIIRTLSQTLKSKINGNEQSRVYFWCGPGANADWGCLKYAKIDCVTRAKLYKSINLRAINCSSLQISAHKSLVTYYNILFVAINSSVPENWGLGFVPRKNLSITSENAPLQNRRCSNFLIGG